MSKMNQKEIDALMFGLYWDAIEHPLTIKNSTRELLVKVASTLNLSEIEENL